MNHKLLTLASAMVLGGCASGWAEYRDKHECRPTDELLKKHELVTEQSTVSVTGVAPSFSPSVSVRVKTYRRFECNNGAIWGPAF